MTFLFSDIPSSERLVYEKLDSSNWEQLLVMFENSKEEFVPSHFKNRERVIEYLECQLNIAPYSHRIAGQDWLFKLKSGEYVGILQLFDLSRETNNNRHRLCSIGITTAKNYRGRYLSLEAVNQLCDYIFENFAIDIILAYTLPENIASIELLKRAGFKEAKDKYVDPKLAYFERIRQVGV